MNLKRTIQEWRNLDPVNIAQRQGRPVAKHALVDAKHDILALAARVEELERALAESQANDRQAMAYLSEVRALVGGDDFPDMVRRCENLRKAIRRLCNIYVVDDYYSGELREELLDRAVERAIDKAVQEAGQ